MSTPKDEVLKPSSPAPTRTPEQALEAMLVAYAAQTSATNPAAAQNLRTILGEDAGLRRNVLKAIEDNDLKAFATEPATGQARGRYDVEARTIYLPGTALDKANVADKNARGDAADMLKEQVRTASLSPEKRLDGMLDQYQKAIFDRKASPRDTTEIDTRIDAWNATLTARYDGAKPPVAAGERVYFAKDDNARERYAAEVRQHLKQAIESSPELKSSVLAQVENGHLVRFRPQKDGEHQGGSYGPRTKELSLDPDVIFRAGDSEMPLDNGKTFVLPKIKSEFYETVGTIGHETDHAKNKDASIAASNRFDADATSVLNGKSPVHDYTGVIEDKLAFDRGNEAKAHLEHYNSVVRSLGSSPTEREIYDANPGRMKMFFNVVEGPPTDRKYPMVSLKDGFVFDPPGGKLLSQANGKNVDAMSKAYFDQAPALALVGPRGNLDYRNNLAIPLITGILDAEKALQARTGKSPDVQIDMQRLKLDHTLIQPDLKLRDGTPGVYYDISNGGKVRLETDKPAPAPALPAAPTPAPVARPASAPLSLEGLGAPAADTLPNPRLAIEKLSPKERGLVDEVVRIAAEKGMSRETGLNAGVAMLAAVKENPLIKDVSKVFAAQDDKGDVRVFASYQPHGDRPPIFHANVNLAQAGDVSLQDSLKRIESVDAQRMRDQSVAPVQRQDDETANPSRGARGQ